MPPTNHVHPLGRFARAVALTVTRTVTLTAALTLPACVTSDARGPERIPVDATTDDTGRRGGPSDADHDTPARDAEPDVPVDATDTDTRGDADATRPDADDAALDPDDDAPGDIGGDTVAPDDASDDVDPPDADATPDTTPDATPDAESDPDAAPDASEPCTIDTAPCDAAASCATQTCDEGVYACTNAGGAWAWRLDTTCDDGDPCTFGERCVVGTCRGTPNPCDDTACLVRTCNGTGSCDEAPRVAEACDDGDACTVGTTCDAAGVCGGGGPAVTCGDTVCNCGETPVSCPSDCPFSVPANACSPGGGDRDGCGDARIIGRAQAATGWSSGTQNTCSARDRFDERCAGLFAVGPDHTHAIYVAAGERVTAELGTVDDACARGEEFHSRLRFRFNPDDGAGGATACPEEGLCAGGPAASDGFTTIRTFDAARDGWLFVIVDGGASAFDEHRGYYTLDVRLSRCVVPGCGC